MEVDGSSFVDNLADQGAAIYGHDLDRFAVTGSEFIGNTAFEDGTVFVTSVHPISGASLLPVAATVEGTTFEHNDAFIGASGLVVDGGASLDVTTSWFCGNIAVDASDISTDEVAATSVMATVHALNVGEASVSFHDGDGSITNATFAGNDTRSLAVSGLSLPSLTTIVNTLFLDPGEFAVTATFADATGHHNGLFGPNGPVWSDTLVAGALNANAVEGLDPLVHEYIDRATTTCDDLNLWLQPGSPHRDAGDPALIDPDGSRSDIGAYGGALSTLPDPDGDGAYADVDCDEADRDRFPGAPEVPYDAIDQDCDGVDWTDVDGDGWDAELVGGLDCNDATALISPSAQEVWYDGLDQDCDGANDYDQDGGRRLR